MRFITIAVLAGLGASAAMAADSSKAILPPAPILEDESSIETWYLRGDVGYVHHKRPEADFTGLPFSGGLVREGIGNSAVAGLGIGYRFGPNLRADVTLDHRFNARFKGVAATSSAILQDRGWFQSSNLMLNGYVDLDPILGFALYLGAGAGVSHGILTGHVQGSTDPPTGDASWTRLAGNKRFDFAWALMAGVGYELSSGFSLDLGYRYVGLGGVKARYGADLASIGAHEVRMGVRYAFD